MILASGAFDGLHAGHVLYLKAASCLRLPNEDLHVAVAPNSYIEGEKARKPYWCQTDRAAVIGELPYVQHVLLQGDPSVAEMVRERRPRLFVKGLDWAGELPTDVIDACDEVGCQIVYVHTPGRHTSEARA